MGLQERVAESKRGVEMKGGGSAKFSEGKGSKQHLWESGKKEMRQADREALKKIAAEGKPFAKKEERD